MITHTLMGGLGNQLFQVVATIAIALRSNQSFFFDTTKDSTVGTTFRTTYWTTLFQSLVTYMDYNKQFIPTNILHIQCNQHHYIDVDPSGQNTLNVLHGYFQSYKYFHQEWNYIQQLMKLTEIRQQLKIDNPHLTLANTISMHFRMGDYRMWLNCHPILSYAYYRDSLKHIVQQCNGPPTVCYFCEDQDLVDVELNIKRLMHENPECSFQRIKDTADWKEMLLMSLCQHHIMANSTFSWWGAYMSDRSEKSIVCYPSVWFGYDIVHKHIVDDMFLPEWTKIETVNIFPSILHVI